MALGIPGIGSITDSAFSGGDSGDAFSGDIRFAPVTVGGLFGSSASSNNFLPLALVAGAVILGAMFFFQRK